MVGEGVRAVLTSVDSAQLAPTFAGRIFDQHLLGELPTWVDPCGERGEFHTFVYAGPMFTKPLPVRLGDLVTRDGFVYADVLWDKQ
jgi:diphthamide synthase (EF-2-diphthine--ammonia ligase)